MKKLFFLTILIIAHLGHCQTDGTIFNVSAARPNITITPKVNFFYKTAGIKVTSSGFNLKNQGIDCKPANNGFCIFDVGPKKPKMLSITGNGKLNYILCTNGLPPTANCQNYSADFSGPAFKKAYVTDANTNTLYTCNINNGGTAISCSNASFTGATPNFNLLQGIAYNAASNKLYVTDIGLDTLYTCEVNASGAATSCSNASFTGATPNFDDPRNLAYNSRNNKIYVIDIGLDTLYTCEVNASGAATSCSDASFSGANPSFVLPSGVAFNAINNKLYAIDATRDTLYTCDVNASGVATSCSNMSFTGANPVFLDPRGVAYNATSNKIYVIDPGRDTLYTCNVNASGVATSCSDASFTDAIPAFMNPRGIAFNDSDNKIYITDFARDTLYTCNVNASGIATSCSDASFTGAIPAFVGPRGVASSG